MAIIDLRHLYKPDVETVIFIGERDGKEYKLPMKTTVQMSINFQVDMDEFSRSAVDMNPIEKNMEISYLAITRWIKTYYEEIDIEWVRKNITDEKLMSALTVKVTEMFFPEPETGTPKKNPKRKRS